MLSLILIIKDNHCKESDDVYGIVITSHGQHTMVRTGDLVPTGTMLVTPGLGSVRY